MVSKRDSLQRGSMFELGGGRIPVADGGGRQQRHSDSKLMKIIAALVCFVLVAGGALLLYRYYAGKQEKQRIENLVWNARYELSVLESDKTVK